MKEKKHYNIVSIFFKVIKQLPQKKQKRFWFILCGMAIAAGIETVALGTIAFFISFVSDPESVLHSSYVKRFNNIFFPDLLISTQSLMVFLSIAVVSLVLLKNVAAGAVTYVNRFYSAYASAYLGGKILDGFIRLPYEWHLSKNSADLILGVMWRDYFGNLLGSSLQALSDILIVVILFAALLFFDPLISLIVILSLGGSGFIIFFRIRKWLDQTVHKVQGYRQSINRDVTKAMHGIKDVKIYSKEKFFTEDYHKKAYTEAKLTALQHVLSQLPQWILEVVGFLMLTSAIYIMYFSMELSTVRITGTLALLAVTAWRVLPAVSRILRTLTIVRTSLPYVENGLAYLGEINGSKEQAKTSEEPDTDFVLKKAIKIDNVSFFYRGSNIKTLKNINITVSSGRTVGIIGISGAGKSTLADMMIGLLSPVEGALLIDGKALDEARLAAWHRLIGYVPQSPYIYEGSLLENVAFGFPPEDIDRNRVEECCEMAAMGDFINDLPNGLDTPIGERGIKLSGGQRQRVSIARALFHRPEVLIFDEATSSLDTRSEKAIQKTIYSFKGKQTLVIIAHRLSTVEDCDELIWLEKGRVRQTGSPEKILPAYRRHMSKGAMDCFSSSASVSAE